MLSNAADEGEKLPAERNRRVRKNDCILEVNGVPTKGKKAIVRDTVVAVFFLSKFNVQIL